MNNPLRYLVGFALSLSACHDIKVPKDPKLDHQPIITLTVKNFRTAYTGTYNNNAIMGVSDGTQIQYIVTAFNACGGVKSIHFSLPDVIGGEYQVNGSPDASGNVPEQLSIATWNNLAIIDDYSGQGRAYTVTATAVNFNNQTTTVVFTVQVDHNAPTSTFIWDKDPRNGSDGDYINAGEGNHANYAITDCNGCTILINGVEGNAVGDQTFVSIAAHRLPASSGKFWFHPTHAYGTLTLTCFSPFGTASQKALHIQWAPPQPTPTAGSTFYYIVHDGSACWTQSVVALSQDDGAAQIRKGTTDVLSIQPASYADFTNPDACPL
jgi:hypothetical protein